MGELIWTADDCSDWRGTTPARMIMRPPLLSEDYLNSPIDGISYWVERNYLMDYIVDVRGLKK